MWKDFLPYGKPIYQEAWTQGTATCARVGVNSKG